MEVCKLAFALVRHWLSASLKLREACGLSGLVVGLWLTAAEESGAGWKRWSSCRFFGNGQSRAVLKRWA